MSNNIVNDFSSYAENKAKGRFEAVAYHSTEFGNFFVTGDIEFNYRLHRKSNVNHVVKLSFITIRGFNSFNTAIGLLSQTRGCYVLYNSITHKIYVGKSDGSNVESPGLESRLNAHKNQPKFEFDTIFCVYVPSQGIDDNLFLAFNGHFLFYLEASIYEKIANGLCLDASLITNTLPLTPKPPQNHDHLHSLVNDYAVNSLLDWMFMTGFSAGRPFQPITKAIENKNELSPNVTLFDFSNVSEVHLKNPVTNSIYKAEYVSASTAFQGIVAHLLNSSLMYIPFPKQGIFWNKLATSLKVWIRYGEVGNVKNFSQRTVSISKNVKLLKSNMELKICVNYDNPTKLRKLQMLVDFLSKEVPEFSTKTLNDFVE